MKNIILILATSSLLLSCIESEDLLTSDAKEGAILDISGSNWNLGGTPTYDVDSTESEVQFLSTNLTYKVALLNESGADVDKLIVTKTYNDQTVKVAEADGGVNGFVTVRYVSSSDFSKGFDGVKSSDFRIDDVITFETTMVMTDGHEYVDPNGTVNIDVTCLSDLSGTYTVTNTACRDTMQRDRVEISQNDDGRWHLTYADGGAMRNCLTGHWDNSGNITEQCGVILFSGDLDFGSDHRSYEIGDIQGGTWDAKTGTLTMHHTQTYLDNWPSEWTSTYIRQ